jgi:hypothetical protein
MPASAKAHRTHYLRQAILLARDRLAQPSLSLTVYYRVHWPVHLWRKKSLSYPASRIP